MEATNSYLESVKKQFLYYKILGEKAMDQLEPEQLFVSINEETNSIATIVKHLSGNMLSRWTDFLTSDGEKEWRNRDNEFVDTIKTKEELLAIYDKKDIQAILTNPKHRQALFGLVKEKIKRLA